MAIDALSHPPDAPVHLVVTDADLASGLLGRSFPGIRLTPTEDGKPFRLEHDRASDGSLSVDRLRLTGTAEADGSIGARAGVGRVLHGRFRLEYGRDEVDTSRPYLRPAGRSLARMADVHLELIRLDQEAFAAQAIARLEGSGRSLRAPAAEATGPLREATLPAWERIADLAASVAFDESAFASPLIRAGLVDLVVAGLLATFALTVETGVVAGLGAGPAAMRRAMAHIDEHLAEPLDVAAIAAAARIPVRTLQTVFRARIGMTPMEHVRARRLAAARDDLLAAEPGAGDSVTAIAHRWGFAHPARFAEQYRRTYGERPSDTLRR